jgi:hypothetical protein
MLSTWRMWWECQWRAVNGVWHYAISTLCNRITWMHRFLTEHNSSNFCWRTRSYKHGVFKICIFATRPDFLRQRWLLGSRMPVTLSVIWPTRYQRPHCMSTCWKDVGECGISKACVCDTQISDLQQHIPQLHDSDFCCLLVCRIW